MTAKGDDKVNSNDITKSCLSCPSFVSADESSEFFGAHTGMAHCARFGHILGMGDMHSRQQIGLQRHHAQKCVEYGMPRPNAPVWVEISPTITLPSRAAFMAEQQFVDQEAEYITNCRDCVFYNRRGAEDKGLRGGAICSARCEFIFDRQVNEKARNCTRGIRADYTQRYRSQITEDVTFDPLLVDAFYKEMSAMERWKESRANFVDPSEYPTDREVEPDEVERGIRAWREIVDDKTGNSVFMPVYDMHALAMRQPEGAERERYLQLAKLVPSTGDDEHPENYIDHQGSVYLLCALWYELDETPALWGSPGTGKTEILRHVAWLMQLPFHRISITATTELEELVGQFVLRDNETSFVHGRLPRAWRSPGVICLDEPNVGPPEVWQAIRPLTDNSKQFVIDKNGGEVISRHPDSFLGLAMNPPWDTRNVGADVIADADSSRLAHILVDYPPAEIEKEIMREWANDPGSGWEISDKVLDQISKISTDLRKMAEEGALSISWGVRHNIKVARASRLFSLQDAYRIAAMNFLSPSEQKTIRSTIASNLG